MFVLLGCLKDFFLWLQDWVQYLLGYLEVEGLTSSHHRLKEFDLWWLKHDISRNILCINIKYQRSCGHVTLSPMAFYDSKKSPKKPKTTWFLMPLWMPHCSFHLFTIPGWHCTDVHTLFTLRQTSIKSSLFDPSVLIRTHFWEKRIFKHQDIDYTYWRVG